MKFRKNIGPINRIGRIVVGIILGLLSFYHLQMPWQIIGTGLGILMVIEGIFGFCAWHTYRGTKDMR